MFLIWKWWLQLSWRFLCKKVIWEEFAVKWSPRHIRKLPGFILNCLMVCLKDKLQSVAWLLHHDKSLIPNTPGLSGFYSYHSPTVTLLMRHKVPKTASPDQAQHNSALYQWGYLWQVGEVWPLLLWALMRWQFLLSWGSLIPKTPASFLTLWLVPERIIWCLGFTMK